MHIFIMFVTVERKRESNNVVNVNSHTLRYTVAVKIYYEK